MDWKLVYKRPWSQAGFALPIPQNRFLWAIQGNTSERLFITMFYKKKLVLIAILKYSGSLT